MVISLDSFHYHVIDVYLQVPLYMMGEHNIHKSLVDGTNVLKAEGA